MAEGRSHPRGEQFSALNSQLSQAVGSFTQLLSTATAFGQAVNQFRTLEQQLALTNAAAGGTLTTFRQMEAASRSFALVTTASAQEAASALFFLAQAGFSVEQSLNAMSSVLILAQATMQDVAFTSDLIASTLKTYNLTSLDGARVANLFAAAQANSLASLDKLAFSLRQVGPVAASMGQEIETTTAFLAELYNVGLRGEQAGTALRNIMVRLIDAPASAEAVFKKYGISVREATGEVRVLEDVLQDLYNVNNGKGISSAEAAALFGVEALAGGLTLIRSVGTGTFDAQREAITGTGKAYEQAAAQLETLDGALKLARNSVNDLFITFGKELAPTLVFIADTIRDLVAAFNSLDESTKSMIVTTGLAVASVATAVALLKGLGLIFSPLTSAAGTFFRAFGTGAANGAKQTGLLAQAFRAIGSLARFVFAGAMVSSIINLGTALTGVSARVTDLRQVFTTLNGIRFIPLIAGLGAVGLAIAGGAGLIYTIYRLGTAWKEQTRIAQEEVAKQRAAILESAGISNSALDNIGGRVSNRDTTMEMAGSLPTLDQIALFRGNRDSANQDLKEIDKIREDYENAAGSILDLREAIEDSRKVANDLVVDNARQPSLLENIMVGLAASSGGYRTAGDLSQAFRQDSAFNVDADQAIRMLQEQTASSTGLYEDVQAWLGQQFSPEAIAGLENSIVQATNRKKFAEQQLAQAERAGITSGDTYDQLTKIVTDADASVASARDRLAAISNGVENDPTVQLLQEAIASRNNLDAMIDAVVADGVVTPEEGEFLTKLQDAMRNKNEALATALGSTIQATQEESARLFSYENLLQGQVAENESLMYLAVENLLRQVINEEVPVTEIFKAESERFREFLSGAREQALPLLRTIMEDGSKSFEDQLFALVGQLNADGVEVPQELLDYIKNVTTRPIRQLTVEAQANRAELNMEIARFKNELAQAQADAADNLSGGIEADSMKAVLDAVEEYQDQADTIADTLKTMLGETWEDIGITEDMAKAMGVQYEAGMTLGDLLNHTAFLDGAAEAAANGASASEVQALTDQAISGFMTTLAASLTALSATMVDADGMITEQGKQLNETVANLTGLLEAARNMQTFKINDAPRAARAGNKYSPKKTRGGKTPQEEARKLKEDFEKELRGVQRDLMELEREILEFDDTLNFTARFTAMIDLDRREIAQKYDQQIQEIQADIAAANEKFKQNPVQLGQLVTGYNQLISQLERAKQAELDYTNSFTYQSKLRNDAIDRQIEAIRNMSMEGERAGTAIMQGMQAGLLMYQKDLRTTVDNVAQATVGVLDGLAQAVGAFVTGQGDAMEILRNAVLNSLNELIVNATKRMLQSLFEGITGGGITGGVTGNGPKIGDDPVQVALSTAGQQTQVVYTNHLSQMQQILSGFSEGFSAALNSTISAVQGAGSGMAGAASSIPGVGPIVKGFQGGVSAVTKAAAPLWDLGKSVGTGVITNLRDGIMQTASALKIDPKELATVISYETGGTFNPRQKGPTTQWGQHQGLIQFGKPQAAQYGADFSSELAALQSQLGPNGAIVKYLQSSGFKPGMGMMDLYSTINAGAPGLYNRSDANNGGAPGTVADKVNQQMAGHYRNAEKLLGDFSGNLGTVAEQTQTAATQFGQQMQQMPQQAMTAMQPVGGVGADGAAIGEAQQMQQVYLQFLQQLQQVLMQFIQQFGMTLQQANIQAGQGGVTGAGGMVVGGGNAGGPTGAMGNSMGGAMQQQMGGFMQMISGLFQNLFGGLGSMLQGLFSQLLGGLGGGGGGIMSLFGGLFDEGGNLPRGKWGIAGEFGPEIIKGPASIVGREDTMNMFRDTANRAQPIMQAAPTVNNIIVQDQSVVARYISTSAGRRQIANVVKQTQNPTG